MVMPMLYFLYVGNHEKKIRGNFTMRKFMKTAMAGTLSLAMVLGVTGVAAPEASAAKVKVKRLQ